MLAKLIDIFSYLHWWELSLTLLLLVFVAASCGYTAWSFLSLMWLEIRRVVIRWFIW